MNDFSSPRLGAEEVVQYVVDHGQDHVFGVTGSNSVAIFNALARRDIEYLQATHESAAISMADGYARVRGAATCSIYMMAGTGNMISNLYDAWRDESPIVVLLSDQDSRMKNGYAGECEGDLVAAVTPFTKLARFVPAGSPLRPWLERAYRTAVGEATGPVALSLPTDVLEGPVLEVAEQPPANRIPAAPRDVDDVVAGLSAAERPLIVVGGQTCRSGGVPAVIELAERFGIPVAYEPAFNDRLSIPPWHPNCFGRLGEGTPADILAADADVVLVVGARCFTVAHGKPGQYFFRKASFIAHVNADPDKLEESQNVHWACACSPKAFLEAVFEGLGAAATDASCIDRRRERMVTVKDGAADAAAQAAEKDPVTVAVSALHDALDHGWIVDESTMSSSRLIGALRSGEVSRYTTTSGGSLGWGPAAACGVAVGSNGPTTCVIGDGALKFGMHGLWTARAYSLPITFFVLDNRAYGSTEFFEAEFVAQHDEKPTNFGSDFNKFAQTTAQLLEGFDIPTTTVAWDADVRAAVTSAWQAAANGPKAVVVTLPDGPTVPPGFTLGAG